MKQIKNALKWLVAIPPVLLFSIPYWIAVIAERAAAKVVYFYEKSWPSYTIRAIVEWVTKDWKNK